jgi:hypothetical protein
VEILEIEQNAGIGQIKLGMEREDVYRVLRKQGDSSATIEWIENYHIEYRNNKVIFVEVPNSASNNCFVLFNGVDIFRTEVKLLVKYIAEYGKYDETDWELGYTYRFPSLGIGLWRPSIFEYEMINNKDFKDMPEEIQLDQMKYLYFEAVCVYASDYYTK